MYLPYTETSADYRIGYCMSNCEAENRRTGAHIVFGWVIWELRCVSFVEAEFHAVVRRGCTLYDITPRKDQEKRILFVPDNKRVAVRHDEHTWDTWSNHKKQGNSFELTQRILIEDPNPNVWA